MKQIVPFKKELPFKTKVSDITSISLEREIEIEKEGIITGIFHITGDYKMNEGSISREDFSFDLPFDITLDPRYDINTVNTDIEDFYYDIINDDTLKVNIDLFIEAEYLPENLTISSDDNDEVENDNSVNNDIEEVDVINIDDDIIHEEKEREEKMGNDKKIEADKKEDRDEVITPSDLFSNLDDAETYSTYYVYIVKEEDTIDKILVNYGVTKEELEDYNDLANINPGDKIIIPKNNEQ